MLLRKSAILLAITSAMSVQAQESSSTEVIEVKGHTHLLRSDLDSLMPSTLIEREQLDLIESSSLGETLKSLPGIHASYFGPSASSPVIRGLDGPRVKVMQNGLDGGDASRSGPDHQVTGESSTATQIEVLRGPATLLYGSGAIGGVINVIDNRIPLTKIEQFSGDVSASFSSGADQKTTSVVLEAGQGNISVHLDGFWRDANETRIPGQAELEAHDKHEAGHHDEAISGKIANSQGNSSGFTLGTSYINDDVMLGVAYGRIDSQYGLIGHAEHEEEHEHDQGQHDHDHGHEHQEQPFIKAQQDRYQLQASWQQPLAQVDKITLKAAHTNYQLQELEGALVATQITNDSTEFKLEVQHQWLAGWQGIIGSHYLYSDFSPVGEEAITAPTETKDLAIFATQKRQFDQFELQFGARVERVTISPQLAASYGDAAVEFTPLSASVGASWQLNDQQQLLFNLSHSQRALSANEIYANGEHLGTSSFDIGIYFDRSSAQVTEPQTEDANALDVSWRYQGDDSVLAVSMYYSRVNNFSYQSQRGSMQGDLPVYQYVQDDVRLYGGEIQHSYFINDNWTLSSFVDYSRVKLLNGENLPRIPPLRIASQLSVELNEWHGNVMVSHYTKQDKIGLNETPTASYTLVDFSIYKHLELDDSELIYFVKASNVFDQEARVHSSFLKGKAPLPGASIKAGVRWSF